MMMILALAAVTLVVALLWGRYDAAIRWADHVWFFSLYSTVLLLVVFSLAAGLRWNHDTADVDAAYLFVFVFAMPVGVETARFLPALFARRRYSIDFISGVLLTSSWFCMMFFVEAAIKEPNTLLNQSYSWQLLRAAPDVAAVVCLAGLSIVLFHHNMFLLIRNIYGSGNQTRLGLVYFVAVSAHAWYQLFLASLLYVLPAHPLKQIAYWGAAVLVMVIAKIVLEMTSKQPAALWRAWPVPVSPGEPTSKP